MFFAFLVFMGFWGIKKVLNKEHREREMLPALTWIIFREKKGFLIKTVYRMQKWLVSFVLKFYLKSIFYFFFICPWTYKKARQTWFSVEETERRSLEFKAWGKMYLAFNEAFALMEKGWYYFNFVEGIQKESSFEFRRISHRNESC